jgi:hypothetical protein
MALEIEIPHQNYYVPRHINNRYIISYYGTTSKIAFTKRRVFRVSTDSDLQIFCHIRTRSHYQNSTDFNLIYILRERPPQI